MQILGHFCHIASYWHPVRKPDFNLLICLITYKSSGGPWPTISESFSDSLVLFCTSKWFDRCFDYYSKIFAENKNMIRLKYSSILEDFRAQLFLPVYEAWSPMWAVFSPACHCTRLLFSPSSSFQSHHLQMPWLSTPHILCQFILFIYRHSLILSSHLSNYYSSDSQPNAGYFF